MLLQLVFAFLLGSLPNSLFPQGNSPSCVFATAARSKKAGVPNIASENYYEVLGLSKEASAGDIKKAFRKLALQW